MSASPRPAALRTYLRAFREVRAFWPHVGLVTAVGLVGTPIGLLPLITCGFTLVSMISATAAIEPLMALTAVAAGLPMMILIHFSQDRLRDRWHAVRTAESDALAVVPEALQAARIDDFIQTLPEGYDTKVGECGALLSGGERQRIALARAFLRDSPILVLDEPTSAVDTETERGIVESLERPMQGRTTLMIAHRIDTLRSCDMVIRIDGGTVTVDRAPGAPVAA